MFIYSFKEIINYNLKYDLKNFLKMTPKNYLSEKKTSNLNISISPALKDWIQRFVIKKKAEFPDDNRYKSTSTLICNIMENVLKIFEKGKTLDDFEKVMDKETEDFYSKYTVNLLAPFVEPNCEFNKFSPVDYSSSITYFFAMRNFFIQNIDPYDPISIRTFFERIRNRYLYGNLTKDITFEIYFDQGNNDFRAVIEHVGTYRNLHYFNAKMLIAVLGLIGFKVTDFNYSEKEIYYRIDFKPTDLFYSKKLAKKERTELLNTNIKYIINMYLILEEDSRHLWTNLAEDGNLYINFKNLRVYEKWMDLIELELRKYGEKEDFLNKILKFFENIHWIRILDTKFLSFQLDLSNEENKKEIKLLFDYLSKFSKVTSENDYYYIESL